MVLDYTFFGRCSMAYQLHSIGWYFLLCLAVMFVFRRSLPPAAGMLALCIFIVDESHAFPVAWWSNRNAVVAVGLGFMGLAAHLRWREQHWRPGLFLSLIAYSAALLAAEIGLGTLAYVLSYELFGAKDKITKRFLYVLPASIVAITYYVFYQFAGYGVTGSDIYIDPAYSPLRYFMVALPRFLILAGTQLFSFPCELTLLHFVWSYPLVLLGTLSIFVIFLILKRIWPNLSEKEQDALRWLIPGAIMAAAPSLVALVSSRVLLAPSLGGSAVIAVIINHLWNAKLHGVATGKKSQLPKWCRYLMWHLVIVHLCIAALSWPIQVFGLNALHDMLNEHIRNSALDESRMRDSQVVLFNASDAYTALYPIALRHFDKIALPKSWLALSLAPFPHRLYRVSEREMELEIVGGQMFTTVFERLIRSKDHPLLPGDYVELDGLRITVIEVGDLGPSRIHLLFDEKPEHERYQLLYFHEHKYRRLIPPDIGEYMFIERAKPW